jgi:hypothetical protein
VHPKSRRTTQPEIKPEENPLDIDWITLGLALLALLAVGGLIPLFISVLAAYNPPIR